MKLFNLKNGWGNEFSPPHLPSVMLVIWHVLRLPFSLFHFRPSGLRGYGAALSRREQKMPGASKRRIGLALAQWFGWAMLCTGSSGVLATNCTSSITTVASGFLPAATSSCYMTANNSSIVHYISYNPTYGSISAVWDAVPTTTLAPSPTVSEHLGVYVGKYIAEGACVPAVDSNLLSSNYQADYNNPTFNTDYCLYTLTDTYLHTLQVRTPSQMNSNYPFVIDPDTAGQYYLLPLNQAPSINSPNTASAAENQTSVLTVTATDPDADPITYSISGGADSASFSIDSSSGVLTFNTAPDYETKSSYIVEVSATDNSLTATQTITVTVTDVVENGSPVFTSCGSETSGRWNYPPQDYQMNVAAAYSACYFLSSSQRYYLNLRAQDDGSGNLQVRPVYAFSSQYTPMPISSMEIGSNISRGIVNEPCDLSVHDTHSLPNNTTQLSFVPNSTYCGYFKTDSHILTIQANTQNLYSDDFTNVSAFYSPPPINQPPTINSPNNASVAENQTSVLTVVATDPDADPITYSISGGADSASFSIDSSSGVLTFNTAPDFETKSSYSVEVSATDNSLTATQTITVTVTDVVENGTPVITSSATPSVAENQTSVLTVVATDPDNDPITYSISGGADSASFGIDSSSGVLTFNTAPDYETKSSYSVEVSATDNSLTATQTITVTVTDVVEGPANITGPANGSTLTADSQVITWNNDGTATNYQIQAGSSAGRNDFYDSGELGSTATSELVVNLPTDGSTIHLRIWYLDNNQTWHFDDHNFTAFDDGGASGSVTPPNVTSHTTGGTFTSATETFTWSDVGATNYWLQIGSSAGRNNHYDSGELASTTTSKTVSDLPTDGTLVHVRIWYKSNGSWEYIPDTSYTAATVAGSGEPTPPTMTLPSVGTALTTASQSFSWSADGATSYWLQIGTSAGRNDYYDSSELAAATDNASGLPIDGSAIHVRVWALSGGKWVYQDFEYNQAQE